MTWCDHLGTQEWVAYEFAQPRRLNQVSVYWFDDSETEDCRAPAEWKLVWLDGKEWKPVKLTGGSKYGTAHDAFATVAFEPVTTKALKLEVKLRDGFSAGILEWTVKDSK